jgi:phage N-6-adenine-methyltransferase
VAIDVHFSSRTDEWATPQAFFHELDAEFHFTLDPCATPENAKCRLFITKEQDGLKQPWAPHTVFVNPPYGRELRHWVRKAYGESLMGATVVCLIPARTDTAVWHDYCMRGEIRFIRGRLKFGGARNSAPFPSAVVIFRPPTEAAA